MDNVKTGAFIKRLRKGKNMTQKELADLLHVTDRAVSKWERGLCAPDISLLEPLAAALDVSIVELISGEYADRGEHADALDFAAKNIIDYSEHEITRKLRALKKKIIVSVLLLSLFLVPALNGMVGGDGFAWQCIPAYLCAQKAARAIVTRDEPMIRTYIGNSEGISAALSALEEQDVKIWEAEAKFFRTRLEDMFLRIEVELIVMHGGIRYQFVCNGTYRNGKVEFMNIVNPSLEHEYPEWMLQLNDVLSTYDPG